VSRFSLSHLSDLALGREVPRLAAAERTSTAELLAALAEVDARGLFARLGYPSLHVYCVEELRFAPDVAGKRIQAARAVREFPALLDAVEDGRLGVTVLVLVAPHLTAENLADVLESVAGRSKRDARAILGQRFPRPLALEAAAAAHEVGATGANVTERTAQQDPDPVLVPGGPAGETLVMVPLSPPAAATPVRFPLHLAVTQCFRDKLAYARDLLGHALPGGEAAEVLERALDAVIEQLEKRRFGNGSRTPSAGARGTRRAGETGERHVPMAVRREVFRRDGGRCTFVGDTGHRCESRRRLELDHVVPIARGGLTTADNLRLRCRTHNRLEVERAFGHEFMRAKRERAAREAAAAATGRPAPVPPPDPAWRADVVAALRTLGYRDREVHAAMATCDLGPKATIEQRVRTALRHLAPPARKQAPAA